MKHYILGILLTAAFAFAQDGFEPLVPDEQTEQATQAEQTATEEPAALQEQAEPVEQAAPDRTPEGYRIIRIGVQETKVYKDSVKKVEIEKNTKPHDPVPFNFSAGFTAAIGLKAMFGKYDKTLYMTDTANGVVSGIDYQLGASVLVPLTEYNFAIRTGVLFNYTGLTASRQTDDRLFVDQLRIKRTVMGREQEDDFNGEISQGRLTIPLLIAMKTMRSPAMFEIGPQFSLPLFDEYEYGSYKDDLKANGIRASMDLAMIIGGEVYVSPKFLINVYLAIAMNDLYKNEDFFVGVTNTSMMELRIGLVYNLF